MALDPVILFFTVLGFVLLTVLMWGRASLKDLD